MQEVIASFKNEFKSFQLPSPEEWVMPGVQWGQFEHALTPAFWVSQAWMAGDHSQKDFQLGRSLAEEVTACLLGGHGAPAEVGLAAYSRVRDEFVRHDSEILSLEIIEPLLLQPLNVNGRSIRYRFARQRARYLAGALEGLQHFNEDELDDITLRETLCELKGIGPKTASWIVRNRRASDNVAILDIHIVRACCLMGVFPEGANISRHYLDLEMRFLEFSQLTKTRASILDSIMWGTMRSISANLMRLMVDRRDGIRQPSTSHNKVGGNDERFQRHKGRLAIG